MGWGEADAVLGAPRTFVGLVQYQNAAKRDVWKVKDQGKGIHLGPEFVEGAAEGALAPSFEGETDEYDTGYDDDVDEVLEDEGYAPISGPEVDTQWVTPIIPSKARKSSSAETSRAGAPLFVGIASLLGGVAVLLGGRREPKQKGAASTPKKPHAREEEAGPPSGIEASERYGPALDAVRLAVEAQDWEAAKADLAHLDGELEVLNMDGRRRAAEFQDVARRKRALEDEVAHMARLVASLEAERDRLNQEKCRADEAEGRETRIKENLEKMEGMLAQAEQRMTELIDENTELEEIRKVQSDEIDELKIELEQARAEVEGKVLECAEMRAELTTLRKEIEETRAELEDSEAFVVRKANAVEKLVGDIDACHAIIADLKRQVNLQAGEGAIGRGPLPGEGAATDMAPEGGNQNAVLEGQQQYSGRFI